MHWGPTNAAAGFMLGTVKLRLAQSMISAIKVLLRFYEKSLGGVFCSKHTRKPWNCDQKRPFSALRWWQLTPLFAKTLFSDVSTHFWKKTEHFALGLATALKKPYFAANGGRERSNSKKRCISAVFLVFETQFFGKHSAKCWRRFPSKYMRLVALESTWRRKCS